MVTDNVPPPADKGLPFPVARDIKISAPFRWIALGMRDLAACPLPALFYGFCFALMGVSMTLVFEHAYAYAMAATSGFLLLGPFLAMGLYEISRRTELRQGCALRPTLTVWRRNAGNIGVFAVVLGLLFLAWARSSLVIFALFYRGDMPNLTGFLQQLLVADHFQFLALYMGAGLIFAIIAFALSLVALPLMLDRNQDAVTSMLGSIAALLRNPLPLLVWAGVITVLTVAGFLTFHLGLVVLMPIIGHASWHAYRELIVPLQPIAEE